MDSQGSINTTAGAAAANAGKREALRGAEVQAFDLLAEFLKQKTWAEIVVAPLEHSVHQGSSSRDIAQKLAGASSDGREALRGAEDETFDLLAEVLTPERWAELLKSPLEGAARDGNRGLAQKLVGAGAAFGSALHLAARYDHADMVNDLLENGVYVDAGNSSPENFTPLHVAARCGVTEMVHLLLRKGADKDAQDTRGSTALYMAARNGFEGAAVALLAAGADLNVRCGYRKKSSVMHAAALGGLVAIVKAGIERGMNMNAGDAQENTALHLAAGKPRVIDVLVGAGANVEARNDEGSTPLLCAAYAGLEAVLTLLKHGAHVNAQDNDRNTPLHRVAITAREQEAAAVMVDALLRSGADETILNNERKAAFDVVGVDPEEEFARQLEEEEGGFEPAEDEEQVTELLDRVRQLLANAPADRAWRRRGYLALCRAHPDRMRLIQDRSSAYAGMARTTCSGAEPGRTGASCSSRAVDACPVDVVGSIDWAVVVAKVLGLQEEGIFRTIVGFL